MADEDDEVLQALQDTNQSSTSDDNPAPSSKLPIIICVLVLIGLVGLLIWIWYDGTLGSKYRPPVEALPTGPAYQDKVVTTTYIKKRMYKDADGNDVPYTWNSVDAKNLKKAGVVKIGLQPVAMKLSPAALATMASIFAASTSDAFTASGNGDTPPPNDRFEDPQDIANFIAKGMPVNPKDLAKLMCPSTNGPYLYFKSVRLPDKDQTLVPTDWQNGYCIRSCDAARLLEETDGTTPDKLQFDHEKQDGVYKVNYEEKMWRDPSHPEAGYTWYCRTVAGPLDGPGWFATIDGIYQRKKVMPIYYSTIKDPFADKGTELDYSLPTTNNFDWKLCSASDIPLPDVLKNRYISQFKNGKGDSNIHLRGSGTPTYFKSGFQQNQTQAIGYNNTNYTLVDFQMVGRYCKWVGGDDYARLGETSSEADEDRSENYHGDLDVKIPLTDNCPQQVVGPDGLHYNMALTPSKLSCYFCPRIYEWQEPTYDNKGKVLQIGKIMSFMTKIRGSEVDGYVCVRQCPFGMSDRAAGPRHYCLPTGIAMGPLPPNVRVVRE